MHDAEIGPGDAGCVLRQPGSDTLGPGPVFTDHVRGKELDVPEPRLMQVVCIAETLAPIHVDGPQDHTVAACGEGQPRLVLRPLGRYVVAIPSSRPYRYAASVVGLKRAHKHMYNIKESSHDRSATHNRLATATPSEQLRKD